MAQLNLIVDGLFKYGEDGNLIFYPFGIFSSGYVIENNQVEKKLRSTAKVFHALANFAIIILITAGPILGLVYSVFIFFLYRISIRNILDWRKKASEPLTFTQSLNSSTEGASLVYLSILIVANSMLLIGIIMAFFSKNVSLFVSIPGVIIFGISLYGFVHMFIKKMNR